MKITDIQDESAIKEFTLEDAYQEGFDEGYRWGKKVKAVETLMIIFITILMGVILGYSWRLYHESRLNTYYESKAEQDLKELEKEFNNSLEKPHEFHIFNHQFCVWPVKSTKPRFHYKKIEIVGAGDNTKQTSRHND